MDQAYMHACYANCNGRVVGSRRMRYIGDASMRLKLHDLTRSAGKLGNLQVDVTKIKS